MTYADKLKDPRWQKKRLEIMQRDDFMCTQCNDNQSTLHVHHVYYKKGIEPWEYPNYLLVTVCETCHKETPLAIERLRESVRLANPKIIADFAAELEQCEPFTSSTLKIFTAILQDEKKNTEIYEWYKSLPIKKQMCERDEE